MSSVLWKFGFIKMKIKTLFLNDEIVSYINGKMYLNISSEEYLELTAQFFHTTKRRGWFGKYQRSIIKLSDFNIVLNTLFYVLITLAD